MRQCQLKSLEAQYGRYPFVPKEYELHHVASLQPQHACQSLLLTIASILTVGSVALHQRPEKIDQREEEA
jgi:hypothetical protein